MRLISPKVCPETQKQSDAPDLGFCWFPSAVNGKADTTLALLIQFNSVELFFILQESLLPENTSSTVTAINVHKPVATSTTSEFPGSGSHSGPSFKTIEH